MQSLTFKTVVTGIASCGNKFVITTDNGEIYTADASKCSIESQLYFPTTSDKVSAIFSSDGDFVWALSDGQIYYSHPKDGSQFIPANLNTPISRIFPYIDGISIVAIPSSVDSDPKSKSEILIVKPTDQSPPTSLSIPSQYPIVGITSYEKKLVVVVSGPQPVIYIFSGVPLSITRQIDIPSRSPSLSFVSSSGSGLLLFWSDGYWMLYTPSLSPTTGNASSSTSIDVCGNRILSVSPTKLRIFDLKFDALLEKFKTEADHALLFSDRICVSSGSEIRFIPWRGQTTTTRSLLGSQTQSKTAKKEIRIEVSYDPDHPNSISQDVQQKSVHFKVKSVKQVVEAVMENRPVPDSTREAVLEKVRNDSSYEDVRDLVEFHLSPFINLDRVLETIADRRIQATLLMLKKLKPLAPQELSQLLKSLLEIRRSGDNRIEVVFAHILTQPHEAGAVEGAVAELSTEEADQLLVFLSQLLESRRRWREIDASLSAEDAVIRWGELVIAKHMTDFALKNITDGMKRLKEQLMVENERIKAAGDCWSILTNVNEDKRQTMPPSFMYIVDHIENN